MSLENIEFNGKRKEINKIFSDLKELSLEINGKINVTCYNAFKKVLIKPQDDEKGYNIKISENMVSNLSIGTVVNKFDYNERRYYLSQENKELTSKDKLFEMIILEETPFYKPKK